MTPKHLHTIDQTVAYVKKTLADAEGGHDWWHIYRVWQLSKTIANGQEANMLIVELGALLHDIADSKFNNGDEEIGPQKAKTFLQSIAVDPLIIEGVDNIIRHISFKGGNQAQTYTSIELDIVQDADRLDAIGAIGIARTFNYGGYKGHEIYNPTITLKPNQTKEEYKNSTAPTINHFYEKLLLLKDRMNTEKGKAIALERHQFMEQYLEQFYREWDGNVG